MAKGYKHLTWQKRLDIERLLLLKYTPAEIAKIIGCCRATVYNELNRASYIHHCGDFWKAEKRYSPELAQERYLKNIRNKGASLKIFQDDNLRDYIESKILYDKFSPAATLMNIKKERLHFNVEIKSVNTIYSYIKKGVFESLSMDECPYKYRKHVKKKIKRAKRALNGKSIEDRPDYITERKEFGHWEMDTVKGKAKNKKCLLVLTERKTRFEYIEILKSGTTIETVRALNRIEKRLGSKFFHIFKTITVDNGSEFKDPDGIEKALYRVGKRTNLYYCHPYCSSERGSNENQNKLIRRHYPKGADFDKILNKQDVKHIEKWINTYPRKIFGGKSAQEMYAKECQKLGSG